MKSRIKSTIGRAAVTALLISLTSVPEIAQPNAASVTLPGHVPAVVASAIAQARDPQAANQAITLTVMLNLTDQAGFKAFEASLQDPSSPNYRHPVSGAEITQRFGPSPEAYNTVLGYLQQSGFTLVEGSNNRRTIMVRGTRAQAEAAFQVSIVDYQRGSFSFHAPSRNPSLPAALAPLIAGISGLSNAARPQQAGIAVAPFKVSGVGAGYNGTITAEGSTNSAGLPPGLTGAGQTVGVIEFGAYQPSDLTNTLATEGLSSHINQVKQYPVAGGAPIADCTFTAGCASTETLVDIAAVLGMAPGANVSVFLGPADSVVQVLNDAIDAVTNGGTTGGILSASFGVCEGNVNASDAANMDSLLEQYSLSGLTMFAATGDHGSVCVDGSGNSYPTTISFPSDLPHAVAVGGTILQVNLPDNAYASEIWWNGPGEAGGGYGVSTIFTTEPAYQNKLYAKAGGRSVPDVAAYAFPGVNICQGSVCATVGGTSLSSPLWAGVWALLNQASSDSCGAMMESATFNGYLYGFSGSGVFHSASSMGSDFQHVGLGSPDIVPLVSQLGCGPVTVSSIKPSSGSGKGGATVTVEGSNFIGVSKVKFGSADATDVTIYSDSKLTAVSPAATADQVQIEVTVPSVAFDATGSNTFSYIPVLTAVSPNFGPFYGGTSVTVTGLALSDKYTFQFGGKAATSVSCSSSTNCTMLTPAVDTTVTCGVNPLVACTIPPPPGLVAVQVIAPVGDSNSAKLFTYQPLTVTEFYPASGPTTGGVGMQIWGTSLKVGMTVDLGGLTATASSCGGSETCVLTLPAAKSAGAVALSVTVEGVTASPSPDQFTYVVYPTITKISPNSIPANTGATAETVTLTITGTGFVAGDTSFIFNVAGGAGALTNVTCLSATQCTANITLAPHVTAIVTQPVAVNVGGYTSLDSVNLMFPWTPPKPVLGCTGTKCS